MPITHLVSHLSGRLGPATNEDRVFVLPDSQHPTIVGVADGATTLTPWKSRQGLTAAQLAADVVSACAAKIDATTQPQSWFDDVLNATLAMRTAEGVPDNEISIATFILYNSFTGQIWMRGDCQYAWELPDGTWQSFEKPMSVLEAEYCAIRSTHIRQLLSQPEYADWQHSAAIRKHVATEGRERIRARRRQSLSDVIPGQTNFTHYTPWENEAGTHPIVTIIPVPAGITKLVVASDGFPRLFPSPEETIAFRSQANGQDPFHIGMGGNTSISPKGVVDHLTGDILTQGDDEAAIWLTFAA